MKSCITCGMPFEGNHEKDIGLETLEGPVCIHDCVHGKVKSAEEIYEGGVQFFIHAVTEGNRNMAEKLCRKNMAMLPYWQTHHCALLGGEQATNAEYHTALAKL